ncbi:MAG: response regulator [Chryseolinea sp.]
MNTIIGLFILFVIVSYVILWRIINAKKTRAIQLERQVQEKSELLAYAVVNQRRAAEQVIDVKKSKVELLSIINHEIRTPLNGILGMVSLLDDTTLTPEQKEYNETIRSCSEGLVTTINEIFMSDTLADSKVVSEKLNLEQKNFDLRNSLDEVFEIFASATARSNLELVHRIDASIPGSIIGDSSQVRQVLMNLVENAITFTREGQIYVKVDLLHQAGNDIELGFEIHDNGLGMSNDKIKLLSQPQHLSANEDSRSTGGNGLLISKRIIESMGGKLHIESIKGKGTIAKFKLLLQKGDQLQRTETDMSAVLGKSILIVEDNIMLRDALREEVTQRGLKVVVANSGSEALEKLALDPSIELVVVEMQMPEMDGSKLAELIKLDYASLPIILLTVASDLESKKQPELFSAVILKPVKYNFLSQHILTALMHKNQGLTVEPTHSTQKLSTDFAKKFPLKILVAEDNRINQKLALKILSKLGYNADIAENGNEVLEEVSKIKYDLIFMDVQMPEMDGLEATRMIRLCLTVQPVIIAMTANAMQGDREECLQAGMDGYLSKPVHLEELVVILEKWSLDIQERV